MARTLIKMVTKSLGDTIGSSPYWEEYRKSSGDDVYVSCNYVDFFQEIYPNIKFIPWGFLNTKLFDKTFYLNFDFSKPLQKGASDQLGLEWKEIRPKVFFKPQKRPIDKKYVVLASQSTCQSRYWNNPGAWEKLVGRLNGIGLEVVSLDQHKVFGVEGWFNEIPKNSIDKTGLPLEEVMNYIYHSEFFVGLSTGIMWLSHALNKHVVVVSGSTHDWCESTIDITRVINKKVCHGCFNEPDKSPFDYGDWLWCPHHKGTKDHFICSKSITVEMVIEEMKKSKII
jgi:autotransporter strand-loop-strand O-heptosyltransferase